MKKIILILIIVFIINGMGQLRAQGDTITLMQCLEASLSNRENIKAAKTDLIASGLQTKSVMAGYLPRVSLAYTFRYNAVIPAQIIPVGLFYPVPTNETQAIKFGTKWQQNIGLSLYQPLIDLTVRTRVAESRINEKIQNNNLASAGTDLQFEVINSYLLVWLHQQEVNEAALDTLRTFNTFKLMKAGYDEGRVYETDLNRALINLNRSLSSFRQSYTELLKEKIYMSFLTGIPVKTILKSGFDFSPFKRTGIFTFHETPLFDSIPSIRQLELNKELTSVQVRSERAVSAPTLGLEGFLGTNQYSEKFDPAGGGGWYGGSYAGLSFKLPLTSGRGSASRIAQLNLQKESIGYRIEDAKSDISNRNMQLVRDIDLLEGKISLTENNIILLKKNLELYRARYDKGLINSFDLLSGETDLQEEYGNLDQLRTQLFQARLELIKNSGMLGVFIERIR